ncbi:nucleoporin 210 [Lycorma delicatula]|uniref:nucleoporin 210 n=1 Tax=Lycorma delicatula TaxID=130591 RepID=UPI003F51AB7B
MAWLNSIMRVFVCFVYVFLSTSVNSSKLNVPRVLLPLFSDFSTNFTLVADGCFKWRTSRLDVIQLIQQDVDPVTGCSSKAVISAISKEMSRNTGIVFAEEVSTGQVLRCDVIVDVITSLRIKYTTRELFIEEAPELFEVRGYDDQGDEFSTLEGVEFLWNIGSRNDNLYVLHGGNSFVRFVAFRDSPYETPPTVSRFDAIGLRGHIVLLEGVKSGSAKVSVQLPHAEYRNVPPVELQLIVVANLIIDPPDAYVLKGDMIKYKLFQVQYGKLEEIKLPSPQYFLEVEKKEIAVTDKTSSLVRGLDLGRTKIILRDRNVDITESDIHFPSASLTVTAPAYLALSLLPHRNWAVLVNQLCTIVVELFDRDNHKLVIGESTTLVTSVSNDMFELRDMNRNGSYLIGVAKRPGIAPVLSKLESVRGSHGELIKIEPVLSAQADLEIFPRLAIKPSEIVLPWYNQIFSPRPEATLKATGGDGVYLWNSANQSVATVTQSGIVRAQSQGQTEVTVAMQRNQHNHESAKVHVLAPGHMEIVDHTLEAEVGAPIFIHVAIYAHKQVFGKLKKIPFTRCQGLPFKVKIRDENFYYNSSAVSSPVGIACAVVAVVGKVVGMTKVTVSYVQDEIDIESDTVVAAYRPLEVLQPTSSETVLAVGSSRHVVWTGGPRPRLGHNFDHSHVISCNRAIIDVQELIINQEGIYVFDVICHALGETDITLTVENKPALANCKSAISTSTVKVFCSKPRFISISSYPLGTSCPMNLNTDRIVAHCAKPLKLMIIVKDDRGRIFDNATSFNVNWALNKKSLATVSQGGHILLEEKAESSYIVPLDHYQTIFPDNETGILRLTATIIGYLMKVISTLGITAESPPFAVTNEGGQVMTPLIETSVTIVLVNDTVITPNKTVIFNHPTNRISLKVSEGSGHYNVLLNTPDVATVNYIETTRTLELIPKVDGLLKIALIDLCLPSKPAVAEVQVLHVGRIEVDVVNRIEKGHCVTAIIHLYDSLDNPLNILDIDLLELRPFVESDIISLKLQLIDSKREIKFAVTGLQLGETKLIFISGREVHEVQSSPISIQVFPPLRLMPRNLTLTIGAVFQLKAIGGPQPDSIMEYFSADHMIAKVSSIGLIETYRLGDITITGMAVGVNKLTGNKIAYCKDSIEVHVVPLESIKIQTPLLKLKVGGRIPVWTSGIPELITPLVLGTIQPPLIFKWHISSPDVIELRDVFFNTGIEIPDKDRLSMRVKALKPGRATLFLNVTVKGSIVKCPDRSSVVLSDFIELEVFEELRLIKPDLGPAAFKPLLLTPETEFQLQTNKDGVEHISYSVHGYPFSGSGLASSSSTIKTSTALTKQSSILSVDGHGLIVTGSASGRALILLRSDKDFSTDQTIGINVEIKPVYYLMMNINAKLRVDSHKQITALPRGLDFEIVLSYHDNIGSEFAAVRSNVKMRTNRFDKVHVARGNVNGSLFASLVGSGNTVLKVWDDAVPYHSKDYIKFNIEHLMFPDKTQLTVGDVVCFSMPLLSEENEKGTWTCADSDILMMERSEGIAHATGKTGTALVTYRLPNAITATTVMQVLPISSIVFLPLDGRNVTNFQDGRYFLAPLLLLNDQISDRNKNMIAKDNECHAIDFNVTYFPFSCEVRFNSLMMSVNILDVFVVRPHFSIETGLYSCQFESAGPLTPKISVLQSNITLRAVSGKIMSDPLVIPFYPAFFVHTPEIHLSDKQPSSFLTITGTPQVLSQIQVLVKSTILLLGSKEKTTIQTTNTYQVKLKQHFWASITKPEHRLNINVVSPLSSQDVLIPVIIHMRNERWLNAPCLGVTEQYLFSSAFDDSSFSFSGLMVFMSIGITIIAVYYGYSTIVGPPRHNRASSVYASPTHSPASIFRTSSPVINSPSSDRSSYMTRQPFSDLEPIYGDPNLSHSPNTSRRSRRLR